MSQQRRSSGRKKLCDLSVESLIRHLSKRGLDPTGPKNVLQSRLVIALKKERAISILSQGLFTVDQGMPPITMMSIQHQQTSTESVAVMDYPPTTGFPGQAQFPQANQQEYTAGHLETKQQKEEESPTFIINAENSDQDTFPIYSNHEEEGQQIEDIQVVFDESLDGYPLSDQYLKQQKLSSKEREISKESEGEEGEFSEHSSEVAKPRKEERDKNYEKDEESRTSSSTSQSQRSTVVSDDHHRKSPKRRSSTSNKSYRSSSSSRYHSDDRSRSGRRQRSSSRSDSRYRDSSDPKYRDSSNTKYRDSADTKYRDSKYRDSQKKYPESHHKYTDSQQNYRRESQEKHHESRHVHRNVDRIDQHRHHQISRYQTRPITNFKNQDRVDLLQNENRRLKLEREKLAREKEELLQREYERQRTDRELIEKEKEELRRSKLQLEEEQRKLLDQQTKQVLPAPATTDSPVKHIDQRIYQGDNRRNFIHKNHLHNNGRFNSPRDPKERQFQRFNNNNNNRNNNDHSPQKFFNRARGFNHHNNNRYRGEYRQPFLRNRRNSADRDVQHHNRDGRKYSSSSFRNYSGALSSRMGLPSKKFNNNYASGQNHQQQDHYQQKYDYQSV